MEVPAAIYCWYSHAVRGAPTRTKRPRVLPGSNRSRDPAGDVSAASDAQRQHWLEQMKIMASAERKGQLWCWDAVYGEARFLQDPLRKATEREGAC